MSRKSGKTSYSPKLRHQMRLDAEKQSKCPKAEMYGSVKECFRKGGARG